MASDTANITVAPSPCTERAATSASIEPEAAQAADATVKRPSPERKSRRRPRRSGVAHTRRRRASAAVGRVAAMPRPTTTRAALRYAWTLAGTLAAVGACYALEAATGQTILYPVSAAVGSAAYLLGGGPALVAAVAGGLGTLPIALSGRSGDLARWVVLMVADA